MDYPPNILDKLTMAVDRTNIPIEQLKKYYDDIYNQLTYDQTFPDDHERHRCAIQQLWVNYVSRPPVRLHTIIPIGYSRIRELKSGSLTARLYVVDTSDRQLHPVVLYDKQVDILTTITLYSIYSDVALGSYSDNITYTADDRTVLGKPDMIEGDIESFLNNFQFPKTTIKDIESNLSRKITTPTSQFTDERDWRVIEGTVEREIVTKNDGKKVGYNVIDFSVLDDEPKILLDGRKRNPGVTIWMNESLMTATKGDFCKFYGTIDKATLKDEDKGKKDPPEPSMNAFYLIKKHSGG